MPQKWWGMFDKKSITLCLGLVIAIPLFLWAFPIQSPDSDEPVTPPSTTKELLALAHSNKASNHIINSFVESQPANSVATELTSHAKSGDQYAQTLLCFLWWEGRNSLRNTEGAIRYCQKSAAQGNAAAMVNLGIMHENQNDLKEAQKWYKKAGDRGWYSLWRMAATGKISMRQKQAASYLRAAAKAEDAHAQYEMGRILNYSGSKPNARKWLKKAAENHDYRGFVELGQIYEAGDGVTKDRAAAKRLFLKAAEANHPVALLRLGYFHSPHINPDATIHDLAEAIKWFERAAKHPERKHRLEAKQRLSTLYNHLNDPEKAKEWLLSGARDNNPSAQFELGRILSSDQNASDAQKREGVKWLLRAKLRGNSSAHHYLSSMYYYTGFQKPYAPYIDWLSKDARAGNSSAALELAKSYLAKNGVDESTSKAIEYLEISATGGQMEAHHLLAVALLNKYSDDPDKLYKAMQHAELAASKNVTSAQLLLSNTYLHGRGVNKDAEKAYAWSLFAAEAEPNEYNVNFKNEIKASLTRSQIEQAERSAEQCARSRFNNCSLLFVKL